MTGVCNLGRRPGWKRFRALARRIGPRIRRPRAAAFPAVAEATVIALLTITVAALQFEEVLFKRSIVIDTSNTEADARYSYADEAASGTSLVKPHGDQALTGSCELRPGYTHPFCGLGLLLNPRNQQQGIDLSGAETISVDLSYQGSGNLLRLTLKNHALGYSRPGGPETDKPNKVDVPVRPGRQTLTLPLADFAVAEWWVLQSKLPQELSAAELDNVVAVEVQTGADARLGRHDIEIDSITFTLRAFTRTQLCAALIFLWAMGIAGLMIQRRRQAEKVQREVAERGHKILDAIPQMVWSATDAGYEYYNRQWEAFTGIKVGGPDGAKRPDLVHPEDRTAAAERWAGSLVSGEPYEAEYRLLHHSGHYRWVLSRGVPERDAEGRVWWYGTCTDIHERVLAARALDQSERLTRAIVSALPDCVSLLDSDGRRLFVNGATVSAYGASGPDQFLGRCWLERLPDDIRGAAEVELRKAQAGELGRLTIFGAGRKWWDMLLAPVADGDGNLFRILVVSRDISHQKLAEERATWTAKHDALTNLPNRRVLQQRLEKLTERSSMSRDAFALVLLDVDNFKGINDSAGHDAGDALLCVFAERLQAAVRSCDTVARLSGDEFALLLPGVGGQGELRTVLERISEDLRKPCVHAGRLFDCNASIGAGIFGRHGSTSAELFKNVDVALYAAKAAGKGNFQIFRPAMRNQMQKRSSMLSLAKQALADRRIVPYYQPKVDLHSGEIVGFEALLRWRHPTKGVQVPAQIAAAFDDLTLAAEISDQVIEGVLRDMVLWRERGIEVGHVAVNASAAEFRNGDFAERLLDRLHAASIPLTAFQLEVTETVFLGRGAESVERALKTLSSAGMKIALDDFGTGYASLSHLQQFPVNILKIDRSFVRELSTSDSQAPIVDAVINLGRSLVMEVVAEGIETQAQHDLLSAAGCKYGQGYFYSRAIPAKRVGALLSGRNTSMRLAA